jgi:hypothetical protein
MSGMDEFRVTKDGLLIPRSWMKGLGARVSIERHGEMLIVEPPARAAARRRLTKAVARIRAAGRALGALSAADVREEVKTARARRARRR